MGLFDVLTGNSDPDPAVPRLPADQLRARLLAIGDPNGKWHVRAGNGDEQADLVGEWGPMDIHMRNIFGISGSRDTKRVLIRLVPEDGIVRVLDHDTGTRWQADIGGASVERSWGRGQSRTIGRKWTFGGGSEGGVGATTEVAFDSEDIKGPLRTAVSASGWGWHNVILGQL